MTYEVICCTNYTDLTESMEFEHSFYCSGIYLFDITEETFIKGESCSTDALIEILYLDFNIKEFFPQGKPNKCGDEPELTDGVF